jgi:hypothetical protein
MYLISAGITIPALILVFIDKNIGLIEPNSNLLTGEESSRITYYKEKVFSFQKSKDLGNGFVAYSAIDTSQGIVAKLSDIDSNLQFLSWLCDSKCTGREQRNPLLFEDISYSIYGEMDDNLNETGNLFADIFYLKTGEIKREVPIIEIPKILQHLNDNQIYGLVTLPEGVIRIDSNWIESSNFPILVVRTSQNCITFGLSIILLQSFFGSILIFTYILKKLNL